MGGAVIFMTALRIGFGIVWRSARVRKARDVVVLSVDDLEVHFLRTGASVHRIIVPDRYGNPEDIVLGHPNVDDYAVDPPNAYFGCVVGRVANRIQHAEYRATRASRKVTLEPNDGPHALHGGSRHWGRQFWEARTFQHDRGPAVEFTRVSRHGDGGFAGRVNARVTYVLTNSQYGRTLMVSMEGEVSRSTPINMVQHTYWNLAGHAAAAQGHTVHDHVLRLASSYMTPVRKDLIPTGAIEPVLRTPYDFTQANTMGPRMAAVPGGGFDNNWVLHSTGHNVKAMCSQPGGMMYRMPRLVAEVRHPASGRGLQIETNAPGLQFYTGNFLDATPGKDGASYVKHAGFCLETQAFPDAVNQVTFPSPVVHPGERYQHHMVMRFFVR